MNEEPRKIITEVSGFTPIFDVVVEQYQDETIAAVFGAIWRFCQMEDGVCRASLETIGQTIGVDKVTVMRHAKTLCEDGYLKDLTPELRHRPHIYAETGKIIMKSRIESVSLRNAAVSQRNPAVSLRNASVSQSQLSKDSIKDSEERERFATIAKRLSELGGGTLNPATADFISEWTRRHTDEWILKAIELAAANNARSAKYVDTILAGWEQKGYPKSREERASERRLNSPKINIREIVSRTMNAKTQ